MVHPFLETYCFACHGKEKQKGKLDLSSYSERGCGEAQPQHVGTLRMAPRLGPRLSCLAACAAAGGAGLQRTLAGCLHQSLRDLPKK